MNNIKTIMITLIVIGNVSLMTFAQSTNPGDFGSLEDYDPLAAPIDSQVLLWLVFGLGYVFFKYKKTYKFTRN